MPKLPVNTPPAEPVEPSDKPHERPRPVAAIRAAVLAALGHPPGLFRLNVIPLWQNNYRVNVLVGSDATTVRTAHSFFVAADDAGRLLKAEPPLTKQY